MDIHVSNLPFKLTEQELSSLFEPYGKVEAVNIILDHKLRQSKGYGFVKMYKDSEAKEAIKALNGFVIEDRPLKVSESVKEEEKKKPALPYWKRTPKKGQKIVTFDDESQAPKERKKRRGHGRGTTY